MRPHAAALKALLHEPRLQIMPGCGDGMGAHLIEEAGFRTGFIPARAFRQCGWRCRTWIWLAVAKWRMQSRLASRPPPTFCGWTMAILATAMLSRCKKSSAHMPAVALRRY